MRWSIIDAFEAVWLSHFLWMKPLSRRHFTQQLITQHAVPTFEGRLQAKCTHSVLPTNIWRKNRMAQKWRRMAQASTKAARPRKRQTSSRLYLQNSNSARALHVQHTFLVHFVIVTPRAHCEISRCMVDANLRRRFSFSKLSYGPWKFNFWTMAYIWNDSGETVYRSLKPRELTLYPRA